MKKKIKKIVLIVVAVMLSFFLFFLMLMMIISSFFPGGRDKVGMDEGSDLIAIKITGNYDGKNGKLVIDGDNIKIKNIIGSGSTTGFSAKTKPGKKGKIVKAEYTAFGPPWNAMEGGGRNAVDGSSQDKDLADGKYICAAPKSVSFWTKVTVGGTGTDQDGKIYTVKDRGGAIIISGNVYHIDLLMKTRAEQNAFGRRQGHAVIGGSQTANLKIKIVGNKKVIITGTANGSEVYAEGTIKNEKIDASGWLGTGASGNIKGGKGTEAMVRWTLKIAQGRNRHGYSQANRTCCFCNKNATPDYDCSSLVTAALAHNNMGADFKKACKTWPYSTHNIGNALARNGWKNLGNLPISKCKRGDILLNPSYHVEIYCGNNILVGAHQNRDGRSGESADNEIYSQKYWGKWWTQVWRFKGK